ncbi:hypothetical protein L596_016263 [Steinernema carpocapsae]|uniref:Granulins domain-containing protein n=1 Tax=Steinernema carpocapsae TaxID=34508 RepID=A0A4U5NI31_STECR|nr:hypothetical protein L596_016263 [Steinernema carpocapsae]
MKLWTLAIKTNHKRRPSRSSTIIKTLFALVLFLTFCSSALSQPCPLGRLCESPKDSFCCRYDGSFCCTSGLKCCRRGSMCDANHNCILVSLKEYSAHPTRRLSTDPCLVGKTIQDIFGFKTS